MTGQMWSGETTGAGMDWFAALDWVFLRNAARLHGFSDWRLPNAREIAAYADHFPGEPGRDLPRIRTDCRAGNEMVRCADPELLRSTTTHVRPFRPDPTHWDLPGLVSAEQLRSSDGGDGDSCACIAVSSTLFDVFSQLHPQAERLYDHVPMVRDLTG
ncbi:hypothetical protein R3X27_05320 [Tropicimonas sp. TH_r6]|uniref:hypothetical protein n=1 Tax=Tropicimonas sp. TH_r6 TaxID=3082085 RepID=UPI0029534A61|nr:hypothetical protein [Tropicimonas sp. TH_r6]MDV7142097.1 hypothetical protein [Tropicimonas sp. TH_r6]